MAYQVTVARGTLASFAMKIGSLKERQIGDNPEMPCMLPHGVQHGVDAKRQASAELSGNFNSLTCLLQITLLPQVDGFVERYTEHPVGVFELFGVIREERAFSVGQDGAPVLLDGVIPACRDRSAGIQKVPPKKPQYIAKSARNGTGLLQQARLGRYTRRLFP